MIRVEFVHWSEYFSKDRPSTINEPFDVRYMEQAPRVGEFVTLVELKLGKVRQVHWDIAAQKASVSVRVHLEDMNPESRPDY